MRKMGAVPRQDFSPLNVSCPVHGMTIPEHELTIDQRKKKNWSAIVYQELCFGARAYLQGMCLSMWSRTMTLLLIMLLFRSCRSNMQQHLFT